MDNQMHFETILFFIVENWEHIKSNKIISKSFNMNTNALCKKLKFQNPQINNYIIQSYVLALTLFYMNLFYLSFG